MQGLKMYLLLMVGVASGLSPASAPQLRNEVCAALAACALFGPGVPAVADGQTEKFRLPPVNKNDVSRCAFRSSSMGQANAARDKLYDLRFCDMGKSKADGFDLSGAILSEADFSGASFRETMLSKAYAKNSKFKEADFTNAVVDRVSFEGSDMQGAVFANAVLTGTSFDGANLRNVDFTEALIGQFDLKNICKNPTLEGENPTTGAPTRDSAGCP